MGRDSVDLTPEGYANFVVHYECDGCTSQHPLCFDSYNDDETAKSPVSTWVLLDKARRQEPPFYYTPSHLPPPSPPL